MVRHLCTGFKRGKLHINEFIEFIGFAERLLQVWDTEMFFSFYFLTTPNSRERNGKKINK